MDVRAKILKNTTYLTVGDKIGYVLQFVFFLYYAKKFGVVPVGEYSFAFFFTYAFALISDLGATVYLLREVSRKKSTDRQLLVDCLVLRMAAFSVLFIVASGAIAVFFHEISMQKLKAILYMGVYWVFFCLADVFLAELNGHEKMGRVALLGIWQKLISTIAGVLFIYWGLNYDAVLISFPISGFIYLLTCVLVSKYSLGPIHIKVQRFSHYRALLRELVPFFFSIILLEILYCQDVLILGFIHDDESVGIYSSAIKIVTFIYGIQAFIHVAVFPVLSRLFVDSRERLIDASNKILRFLVVAGLPLSFGLTLTSDKIIRLLYSDSFREAGIVLKITSWAIAAGFIHAIFSALLTAINRQKEKVMYIAINFVLSTALNILFIYYFNYIGAAIVKVITSVVGLVFFAYLTSKYLTVLPVFKYALKPLAACLIMTAFGYYFYDWNIIYLIPVSGILYIASLFILREFTDEEIQYVKNFIPKALLSR